jgi:hypothetical protein
MNKEIHNLYRKYYTDEPQKDNMNGKYYIIDEDGNKIYQEE